jgi:ABC-type Fe3+/spermidine/putrescine transport system ATPase subunit
LVVTAKGLKIRVSPASEREVRQGAPLRVALRPEKVQMTSSPVTEGGNRCTGTIKHIVYLGTVTHYYVTNEEGEAFVVYLQNQQTSHTCGPWRVGDTVHLSWKPERTLIVENGDEDGDSVETEECV